jgi:hypothetical protein
MSCGVMWRVEWRDVVGTRGWMRSGVVLCMTVLHRMVMCGRTWLCAVMCWELTHKGLRIRVRAVIGVE